MNNSKVICLAGMHRSGTSLMASYLEACGIPMGDKLLGAGIGNELGHFEDMEFLEFHKNLLTSNGTDMYAGKEALKIPPEYQDRAIKLLNTRSSKYPIWGWKEPRTTLFLNFWNKNCDDIRFIFLYRDPYEVIHSLYRRMKLKYLFFTPWKAPRAWIRYNEELLKFTADNTDNCIVISLAEFISNPDIKSKELSNFLEVDLPVNFEEFYKPSQMNRKATSWRERLISIYIFVIKIFLGKKLKMTTDELDNTCISHNPAS